MNRKQSQRYLAALAVLAIFMAGFAAAALAQAQTNFVIVGSEKVTNQFEAYAQVEPIAPLSIRAGEVGDVAGLEIVPGATVQVGQRLAGLGGPEIQALLAQAESAANSAQTNLSVVKKSLAIERQQLASHLVTAQMVLQSEAAAARAQAAWDAAQAQLRTMRQLAEIRSPVAGTILSINAANGERVDMSQVICILQPTNGIWLKAGYYGVDAASIHVGMTGLFSPADGAAPIPVKVAAISGALSPDGSESVGLVPVASSHGWLNGEFGTVALNGKVRSLPAVPTQALILDHGKWWVLLHTATGERPQEVLPGPTRGWQTFIERGLEPGAQVVVENGYRQFYRKTFKAYQADD